MFLKSIFTSFAVFLQLFQLTRMQKKYFQKLESNTRKIGFGELPNVKTVGVDF